MLELLLVLVLVLVPVLELIVLVVVVANPYFLCPPVLLESSSPPTPPGESVPAALLEPDGWWIIPSHSQLFLPRVTLFPLFSTSIFPLETQYFPFRTPVFSL